MWHIFFTSVSVTKSLCDRMIVSRWNVKIEAKCWDSARFCPRWEMLHILTWCGLWTQKSWTLWRCRCWGCFKKYKNEVTQNKRRHELDCLIRHLGLFSWFHKLKRSNYRKSVTLTTATTRATCHWFTTCSIQASAFLSLHQLSLYTLHPLYLIK